MNSAPGLTHLTIPGDLTTETAPDLIETIRGACQAPEPAVVLDLEAAERVDSAGLGALVRGLKIARDAGGSLVIGRASGEVCRMLSLTGLDQVVPVTPAAPRAG